LKKISSIWFKLSRNGLREDEGVFGHREVILLNKGLALGPLIMLVLLPVEILVNGFKFIPLELLLILVMVFCFILQRNRFFMAGKFLSVILCLAFIVYAGIMVGKGVGNHIAFIPICLFGMLLFRRTRDKVIVFFLTLFCYFLLTYLRNTVSPYFTTTDDIREFFTNIYFVMTLVLTFFMGIYFLGINDEYEGLIIEQRESLALRNREVTDSIRYARRIQQCLLAHDSFLKEHLPEHFVLYKPKDIVSGDFYWAARITDSGNDLFYLAVCDSTGHGVPGAFMSLLNSSFLNEAINDKNILQPCKIFDHVRQRLCDSISKEGQKDGFDGILLCIKQGSSNITYAAANNQPVLVTNSECTELGADRMPVGIGEKIAQFSHFELDLRKGDMLYLYTDGFADQFGGPKGKKYKYSQLNSLLMQISDKSVAEQKETLAGSFDSWKGSLEQVDDVCVVGISF
jgi:serine phosphatase RsbU (regulator of sigma subunit)